MRNYQTLRESQNSQIQTIENTYKPNSGSQTANSNFMSARDQYDAETSQQARTSRQLPRKAKNQWFLKSPTKTGFYDSSFKVLPTLNHKNRLDN